jgi:hypothetical protein
LRATSFLVLLLRLTVFIYLCWKSVALSVSLILNTTSSPNVFFALPFGHTNVLSHYVFDFFSLIGRSLPKLVRADEKLRASFSRAIRVGVSQSFNSAIRRSQISAAQERAIVSVPLAMLYAPLML